MAPKRSTPLADPPPASSSEEEETSSGEEEEEEEEEGQEGSSSEEEEEEEEQQTQTVTQKQPTKKAESESDTESGSDTGSDSDDDDGKPKTAPNSTVKPIASKPMEETPTKNTKPRSKPAAKSTTTTTTSTAAVKRGGSEVDRDTKDSKRAKKDTDGVAEKSEDTKKHLFQRLWSEDDEIVVLQGIIDFMEKNGIDPAKDMISFFDNIKKSLHFDVSLAQLKDKVWRLKKKFENHVKKGKKGEDKTFSKPHDQKTFDLSKKIWGVDGTIGASDSSIKANGKAKKSASNSSNNNSKSLAALKAELGMNVDKESEKVDKMEVEMDGHYGLKHVGKFDKFVGIAGMEDYVVRKGLEMVDGAKKAEMEEKWKKLHVAELELFLKRNELIREQAKLILSSYKKE